MNEKGLSEEQKQRIMAIEKEWMEEVAKIPESDTKNWPNIKANQPYRELEKKYLAKIKAIYNE